MSTIDTTTPASSTDPFPFTFPRGRELVAGRLVRRYKRFLADVNLDTGETITAHCPNTGAMEGLTVPGLRVWLSRSDDPKRKLAYTWELVESAQGVLCGANTMVPNRVVRRVLEGPGIPWLGKFDSLRAEAPLGERSRADFLLERGTRKTWVEVKNCHLAYPDGRAYFPDAVTTRGRRHLEELAHAASRARSHRAHVVFTCQMPGVRAVRPSDVHDPELAATARRVRREGVYFSALEILHTPEEITVSRRVPVDLKPYGTARVERYRQESRRSTGSPP